MKLSQFSRVIKIAYIWQKYGLDETLFVIPWLRPLKPLLWLNPASWFVNRKRSYPQRLCLALEALGPLFIKFGQVLSTRADLFSEDIAHALAQLQDQVKPFESPVATKIITHSLKRPINEVFQQLDEAPLASASIAQVHAGVLRDGREVVVKVLRPGIRKTITQDIALLYTIAKLLDRHWPHAKRLHLIDVVAELERSLLGELDLMREAANASQLKRNNRHRPGVYIPEVMWDYCSHRILVMERLYGTPISDINALHDQGINLKQLAERGIEIFYQTVFEDCFFHADMHPGNILINVQSGVPTYALMDFGIVGALSETDQHYLAANFLAFFKRDYRRVAELHIESGWVPANTNVLELESAIRTVCEPIFDKPLKDISMGHTLFRLLQMARQFNVEIQPQLILMQKTLLNIEGIGRQLCPDLDLWSTAKPFLEQWMQRQMGPRALIKRIRQQLPRLSQRLPEMPDLLYQWLQNPSTHDATTSSQPAAMPTQPTKKPFWRGLISGIGIVLILWWVYHTFGQTWHP